MIPTESFFGGVLYIDLRNYTSIVDEKDLKDIADIIYAYQECITVHLYKIFDTNEIKSIEYMGDGVLIVFNGDANHVLDNNHNNFGSKLYTNAKILRTHVNNLLEEKKVRYTRLQKLDFGMGISCSRIYVKNIFEEDELKRKMFFGQSLNRAAKIGDKMDRSKSHLGIDRYMYDDFLVHSLTELEQNRMVHNGDPIIHVYEENNIIVIQ